jgi:hypothetical protein
MRALTVMRALTDVLPGPDGPLPLLILDQRPDLAERRGPAEHGNLSASALLSMGLTPVTATTTTTAMSEPPVPAPGWRLELSAVRAARLTAPDGSIIWAGACGQPRPWRELITRTSRCAVLIGAIGLWPGSGERAPTRMQTRLDQAAQAGELAGGLVAACC